VDTAIDLLVLSNRHKVKILRRSVVHFIKKNIAKLMDRTEWERLEKNYAHLARTFNVQLKLARNVLMKKIA
jgi:hypothetical protein